MVSGYEDRPLTNLEDLQLKAHQVKKESLDSTRRMVQLCAASQSAGEKTIEMLEHQGEQLNRIENGMETMNSEMKEAEKLITGMEKWCGLCVCPWNRPAKIRDVDGTWSNKNRNGEPVSNQPTSDRPGTNVPDSSKSGPPIDNDALEDEMKDNMKMVFDMVGNLNNVAKDMANEMEIQMTQIGRINTKGEDVDTRIKDATERTEKLLK